MFRITSIVACLLINNMLNAQTRKEVPQKVDRPLIAVKGTPSSGTEPLSPKKLWELGRVNAEGLTADGSQLIFAVSNYQFEENKSEKNLFVIPVNGGEAKPFTNSIGGESVLQVNANNEVLYLHKGQIWSKNLGDSEAKQLTNEESGLENVKLSPDGKYILYSKPVLLKNYHSVDKYKDLTKSNVYIYDNLDYRHWDTWNDGKFNHPFVAKYDQGKLSDPVDLMEGELFSSPQAPFGGSEDFTWSSDSKSVLYVAKKKFGTDYAVSTNTDIFQYDLASRQTRNLTEGMLGYDTNPQFNKEGNLLTWLSMKTDGYEADKNDIIVWDPQSNRKVNLTAHWDGTVNSYTWSKDNKKIFFTAASKGTVQLFEIDINKGDWSKQTTAVKQLSAGEFDITGIVGETKEGLIVTSTKLTRAAEVFLFSFKNKSLKQITQVNDAAYAQISETKVESRVTKASDGLDLFSWVIYPPDFDPSKKYPTLLFCQGGPQAATTQSYSFRWNFQLMAAQGYIVIAPNRRGMPGWGVKWNEQISKDWGGQSIRDYLSAIDDIAKESYVDKDRIGAVGASYGGYSVFMLAGVHEGRFKSFISHCGLFDMESWYGTTEELFFANHDLGGPYWEKGNEKTYHDFNPMRHVNAWNTPILIFQGGKDYRVPIGQGQEAFQAAQLKGIKSRFVYLPDENHWVLSGHNAQVWQREFFTWLSETL
ncbi:alpha/beta fold hydrolase [Sphingobacterium sp. HJSM2_6]|uniref:S9 family peptidase n=1 Tax=Sphingobacterium sp. HJSM2_6 TaxID=3366264 RepID=UPI003BDFFE42